MRKHKLTAVHDQDLAGVLDSLGVLAAFNRGELKCVFCGETITWDNLHSLFPESGAVKVVCDKAVCIGSMLLRRQGFKTASTHDVFAQKAG